MTAEKPKTPKLDIRFDCRYYTGYKPCGRHPDCNGDCPAYAPRGTEILIIKLGAMGDVLRTTPVLRILKQQYDPSYITWITDPESECLLRHNPMVDRLLLWSPDACLQLQAENFDLSLNFEKEYRALALDQLVRAVEKRGFALHPANTMGIHNAAAEYALRLGIDDKIKFETNEKSMPQILVEMAGYDFDGEEYVLEIPPAARDFADRLKDAEGLSDRLVIGLNTGCGAVFPTKQWPRENFLRLVELLHEKTDCALLLLGGPREREINGWILDHAPAGALIDTGCDNGLEDFMGIIEVCDVVVSADSLAMHLAIGRKKRTIALIGPTSATEIDLYERGEKVISDFDCAPCYRTACDREPFCMQALSAEDVFRAIMNQIEDD
ncbi:MAG: glycosyltransferase family 9 protein [Candidatus Sumerlaeota bacterium]